MMKKVPLIHKATAPAKPAGTAAVRLVPGPMSPAPATIFALSSGRPPAAIAVVRISGPQAGVALAALAGRVPAPRRAVLARLRDPRNGENLDEALTLWLPGPRSETGEDTVELQLHGGQAVIAGVIDALSAIEGCRLAEPGEFTRRAFENGRLDLTAVEGLADLIAAQTAAQRRLAFRQLKGLIGERAEEWRRRLTQALALVEAQIDFADEADVPEDLVRPALDGARELRAEIAWCLADGGRGERMRDGLIVAIAGPPNAGKSALLNRLAKREAAIVSPHPGTTRDVVEVHLDLAGYPLTLLDTAGIREAADPVEQEGVRRARDRAAAADLVLWVTDAALSAGQAQKEQEQTSTQACAAALWRLRNKADLIGHRSARACGEANNTFTVSAHTGYGMDRLVTALTAYAQDYFASTEAAMITRSRHRRALQETVAALDRASGHLGHDAAAAEELVAEDLRAAATALGRLTGRVDVEDILDVIFRDFCIGK